MILDELGEFCDAASAILAVGNAIIGDVVDTGLLPTNFFDSNNRILNDLGNGEPILFVIQVTTTFVGATSTTQFQLASDSTANLATSRTNHLTLGPYPVATLVAGFTVAVYLPIEALYERFLGVWETVATANVTAGAINAFLTKDLAKWRPYASALTQTGG